MNLWSPSFWAPGFWAPSVWGEEAAASLSAAAVAAFTVAGDALPPVHVERPPYVVAVQQPNFPLLRPGLNLHLCKDASITFAAQVRSFGLVSCTKRNLTLLPPPRAWLFNSLNSDYQFLGVFDESNGP